jgi:CelD/BcsL family acetyltransferase involved in cellulose biosynthesis
MGALMTTRTISIGTQIDVLRGGIEVIDHLAAEWRSLCESCGDAEPFVRPEFIRAYLIAFEPECRLVIVTARFDGKLTALLPLISEHVSFDGLPVRKLRGAAGTHSARFDLVCAPGPLGEKAIHAIWQTLEEMRDWDMIELPLVSEPATARKMVAIAEGRGFSTGWWDAYPGPYVTIGNEDPKTEPWLQATSANFRQRVRRMRRKAESEGELQLKSYSTPDAEVLARFYELESSGWKGQHGTAIVCDPSTRLFYDELSRGAGEYGYFRCYFLTLQDKLVAGFLGLADGKRFFMLKPAYNEEFAQYSPGHLMAASVLQDCAENGLQEFDFMPPALRWKTDWSSSAHPSGYGYIFRKGFYGKMLWNIKFRLRPWVKQKAQGLRKKPAA